MKNCRITAALALFVAMLAGSLPNTIHAQEQTPSPDDAIALEQQGKLPEAEEAWRGVTKLHPEDAAAFASLGVVLSKEQKYPDAAASYREALTLDPKLPGVELNLGLAEFKQGHFPEAAEALRLALTGDSSNTQARTLLGLSYYGAQRYEDAVENLKPIAKGPAGNPELRRVLAQSCLWAKNYPCALEQFRQFLEEDPNSVTTHILTGEALDGQGKTEEAIVEFKAAASIGPREPNVHFGLGYLYWKSHQYVDAKREFQAELAIDPEHAQALAYLGDIAIKANDLDAALPFLRKSIQLKNDIRVAAIDLAIVLAQQKKYPEAVTAFQNAVAINPTEADVHYRLGRVYQEMGKKQESQEEFAKVRDLKTKADQKAEDLLHKMSSAPPALDAPPPSN